jgi:hypothetical protein
MRKLSDLIFSRIFMACQFESVDLTGHVLFSSVVERTAQTDYLVPDTTRLFVTEKTFGTPFA